ncbi:MAG: hypothetical protein IJP13_05370 [Lachnospiraceae bacterium]|nr:hypothetical protein [Lachnospiraceae bacterium]
MSRISVKVKGIVEYKGKYLLIQKWYDDNIVNPYKWEFIDCEVEAGKGPDETVIDSVETGVGLGVESSKLFYTWTYTVGDIFHIGIAYLCKVDGDIVLMSDDYSDFVWVTPEQFADYIEDTNLLNDLEKHHIIGGNNDDDQLELNV